MKIDKKQIFNILPNFYSSQINDLSEKIFLVKNWNGNISTKKLYEYSIKKSFLYFFDFNEEEIEDDKFYKDYLSFLNIYLDFITSNERVNKLINNVINIMDKGWNDNEEQINNLLNEEIFSNEEYADSLKENFIYNSFLKNSFKKNTNTNAEDDFNEKNYVNNLPVDISFSRWFMPTFSKMNTTANRMMMLLIGSYNKIYKENNLQKLDEISLYEINEKKEIVDIKENKILYLNEVKKIDTNIKFKKNDFYNLLGYSNENNQIRGLPYNKEYKNEIQEDEYNFVFEFKNKSKFYITSNFKGTDLKIWKQIEATYGLNNMTGTCLDLTSFAMSDEEVVFGINMHAIPLFNAMAKFFGTVKMKSIISLKGKSLIMYEALRIIQGNKEFLDYTLYIATDESRRSSNKKNDSTHSIRSIFNLEDKDKEGNYMHYKTNEYKLANLARKTFDDINEYSSDMLITNIKEIKKGKKVKGFSFTIQNKENKTINLLNTYDKKYKICTNLIEQTTDSQRLEIYQAIESQKFRNLYSNLSDEEVEFAKPSYLKLCFDFMLQKYETNNIKNSEIRNPVALIKFYLFNGANIYDGLNAKAKSDGIIVWTPNDSVKTALDTDINKKKKHEEEWANEDEWLKDFYKKVGEIDKHENEPLKEDWIDEWYRKAAEIKYE